MPHKIRKDSISVNAKVGKCVDCNNVVSPFKGVVAEEDGVWVIFCVSCINEKINS